MDFNGSMDWLRGTFTGNWLDFPEKRGFPVSIFPQTHETVGFAIEV